MTKLKKVVLALTLVLGFVVFTTSPSTAEASANEIDPGPIVKPMSFGIKLDR